MATGTPVVVRSPRGLVGRVDAGGPLVEVDCWTVDVVEDVLLAANVDGIVDAVVWSVVTVPVPQEIVTINASVRSPTAGATSVDVRTVARYWLPAYCVVVFGPLNGVRVALVAAAAVAALAAFFTGFTGAGVVLLVGVTIHGVGWLYLYNQRDSDVSD